MVNDPTFVIDDPVVGISAVILAGGQSLRMGGVNKALLTLGGRPIIERVLSVLTPIFPEVILITNTPHDFHYLGLPMFKDLIPGSGSLGGLYTGLSLCAGSHGFLVACDMPFLKEPIVRRLIGLVGDHDVVIPRIRDRLEPLHAVYSKRCLPHIEELIRSGNLTILNFFHQVNVLEVGQTYLASLDPEYRFVINLNTPEDFERAKSLDKQQT
jgi:molybdopterin-guanine dinucleotide biosynthesis protein A